jgi:4-hydroxy-tetrahydrodipicolinate synthase
VGARPQWLLADDATAADQLALTVRETLAAPVFTLDAATPAGADRLPPDAVRVLNTGTRALTPEAARARLAQLTALWRDAGAPLPVVQVDSRLRGLGNALRGLLEGLQFDALVFVPAEPELGRLVREGVAYHAEGGRWTLFHESALAGPGLCTSALREWLAAELGLPAERIRSVPETVVERGPDALALEIERLCTGEKPVVVPDVTRAEHFARISAALGRMRSRRILLAGSRTFLRAHFAALSGGTAARATDAGLETFVDTRRRAAPLAVVASTETAMLAQCTGAQRALGPNLVVVPFDAACARDRDAARAAEAARVRDVVRAALRAMRPVLLRATDTPAPGGLEEQQRLLDALAAAVADPALMRAVSALFVSGGQTAETLRRALGVGAVEIRGAMEPGVPWGVARGGVADGLPWVSKGGRLGSEPVLTRFFEQTHPWPRANILPVVTPLTPERQIDGEGIERLLEHLLRLGTTDIFAVGNAGEFRFLKPAQRREALERFIRAARGRLRVFGGITGDTPEETRALYEAAAQWGARAAVAMPLHFLNRSEDVPAWVAGLRETGANLPLILYNNPARTRGENLAFEIVETLEFPVVAIKDSSGDPARLARYAASFPVYQGQQRQLWEGWLQGARGAVAILGHVSPLPNEFFAPGTPPERRETIAREINDLSQRVKQGAPEVAAYKFVLSLAGIIGDTVASDDPTRQLTPAQREQIQRSTTELVARLRSGAMPPEPRADSQRSCSTR